MYSEKQIKASKQQKILDEYEFIPIGNQSIIFSSVSHNIHFLNEPSTLIWQRYNIDRVSIQEISEEITSRFEVPLEIAFQDVESTINYWLTIFLDTPFTEKKEAGTLIPNHDDTTMYQHKTLIQLPTILINVNSNDSQSIQAIETIFSYLLVKEVTKPCDYQIYIIHSNDEFLICLKDKVLETAQSSEHIPVMLHRAITELACNHNDWLAILHASGVSYKDSALVFPSVGGSGKSTLVAALVQSGFNYLNDDVVPLLKDQSLAPIPVSLCIKSGSWKVLKRWYPEINKLDSYGRNNLCIKYLQPPVEAIQDQIIRSKFLIVPKYNADIKDGTIEAISTFEALQAIIEAESLIMKPFTKENIEALIQWVENNECYFLEYSSLTFCIDTISKLVKKPLI